MTADAISSKPRARRSPASADPAKRRRIVAAYRAGTLTAGEIAETYGVASNVVCRILREEGIPIARKRN